MEVGAVEKQGKKKKKNREKNHPTVFFKDDPC